MKTAYLLKLHVVGFMPSLRKMTFIFDEENEGCLFTSQVSLWGIGPPGKWAHRKVFAAVRQHMKEEGENRFIENQIHSAV